MRAFLCLLLLGCGGGSVVADAGDDATFDAKPGKDSGMDLSTDGSADADLPDTSLPPGCERIPPSDGGSFTQPCGKKLCDPSFQYCEEYFSGIPMNPPDPPFFSCKQAPVRCASKVTCACLGQCLPGNPFECNDDGGAVVGVAGQ
jgi:hypothetical protein